MHRFKRNQVEEAIVQTVAANSGHAGEIKSRLQRLLVTDRRLASRKRKEPNGHSRFAFHSQKAPGSGVEVMFSQYEAFALLIGLLMLQHGIPQATVVTILRRLRGDLEILHRESLEKDRKRLFDAQALKAMARSGLIPTDNTDPAFLVSVERTGTTAEQVRAATTVCRGHKGMADFIEKYSAPGLGSTFFELVTLTHRLADNLAKTRPIKRGRSTV